MQATAFVTTEIKAIIVIAGADVLKLMRTRFTEVWAAMVGIGNLL